MTVPVTELLTVSTFKTTNSMFLLVFFDLKVLTVRTFKSKTVLENRDRPDYKSRNGYEKPLTVSTLKP